MTRLTSWMQFAGAACLLVAGCRYIPAPPTEEQDPAPDLFQNKPAAPPPGMEYPEGMGAPPAGPGGQQTPPGGSPETPKPKGETPNGDSSPPSTPERDGSGASGSKAEEKPQP